MQGQCDADLVATLEAREDYKTAEASGDVVGLLNIIQAEALGHEDLMHPALSVANGLRRLLLMRQDRKQDKRGLLQFLLQPGKGARDQRGCTSDQGSDRV